MGTTGLGQLLRSEWTKLRSVRRWTLSLLATVVLTLLVSLLGAAGSSSDVNEHPDEIGAAGPGGLRVKDEFHFVHQSLTGDGSITARVVNLTGEKRPGHEWAKAGVMIKESTRAGSPYAALMVTPGHGVRLQHNYANDLAASENTAPRWLRLTRTGTTITGDESGDGVTWRAVGRVSLAGLPQTLEIGLFVASPVEYRTERGLAGSSSGSRPTLGIATFDNVRVAPVLPQPPAEWRDHDTSTGFEDGGSSTEADGVFTVSASGDIAPYPPDEDVVRLGLTGVFIGLIAIVAVAVLFITSEYRRDMIRTTFIATPRRGRVLMAKALTIGGAAFAVGLVTSLAAFLLTQPVLRSSGFGPPAYPVPSLSDPVVLRAVVGTAAVLSLLAVFALAVGTILRRSAGAITLVILLVVVPQLIVTALPVSAGQWLMRLTPVAGFAIQQTTPRYDHVSGLCLPESGCFIDEPWLGFGVLCAYAAVGLAIAAWLLRRRDA